MWYDRFSFKTYIFVSILLVGLFAIVLFWMEQPLICTCEYVKLWHGYTMSDENSQHLFDWYSFTHVLHGFGFYLLLWAFGRRLPIGLRLFLAVFLEASWKVFENTDFIINRYRETALALDYFGDSVINSVGDIFVAALGFYLAYRLPAWATITLFVLLELFLAYMIRDSFLLNIIMLIYPVDAINVWQSGG